MIEPMIQGADIRAALADLKEVEPKLYNSLRKDLRSAMGGLASRVQGAFPPAAQLSGFNHLGRTAYEAPKASATFTPGRSRRGGTTSLMGIRVKIPAARVGAWLSEMAGMRGVARVGGQSRGYTKNGAAAVHRLNGQGAYMIDRLNRRTPMKGRGGRYGWAEFVQGKAEVRTKGLMILENAVGELNRSGQ